MSKHYADNVLDSFSDGHAVSVEWGDKAEADGFVLGFAEKGSTIETTNFSFGE